LAFAAVEGIFFRCILFYLLVEKRLMPGLTFSNELISRDEGVHCDFAVLAPITWLTVPKELEKFIVDALKIEREFITGHQYLYWNERRIDDTVLEFVADRLLVELGCDRIQYGILLILWI
jgi:ribonucleoside-diphosphate reductase beta chain